MIRYLADYSYGHSEADRNPNALDTFARPARGENSEITYNILLEYGQADLDERFAAILQPVLQTEVEGFWKDLFEVADAVKGIHRFENRRGGVSQEYRGYV